MFIPDLLVYLLGLGYVLIGAGLGTGIGWYSADLLRLERRDQKEAAERGATSARSGGRRIHRGCPLPPLRPVTVFAMQDVVFKEP